MFNTIFKDKVPYLFLLLVSVWWAFYYQHSSVLNDFGDANFEWFFLIDGLLVAPILSFIFVEDPKKAVKQSVFLMLAAILIGSIIIPAEQKHIWVLLEYGRYPVIALFILFEVLTVATTIWAIHKALSVQGDPDRAIDKAVKKLGLPGPFISLISVEIRMWLYTFAGKRIAIQHFCGLHHFTYHQKDGAQSNAFGFIFIMIFELPLMHVFLHFVWSPFAANVVTFLSILSLIWFYAEFRAMSRRPISVTESCLIIRYGLLPEYNIKLSNIEQIRINTAKVARSKNRKRYNFAGAPNICITLKPSTNQVNEIYLGVDNPDSFVKLICENTSL
ncbi:hypothetical protein [Alteromonas sp. ASW11-130]|uniref:hypothetical protein n=1 Tax=Alteromonas sp. ASW11-130 TaxID=3015775 RepID=UPI002242BE4C|nr:hypothetical protein [Alteromonas sp. ASW11-130]MCW8092413.1 hypothetical protein [Alteromonas sp. ASW11-130]